LFLRARESMIGPNRWGRNPRCNGAARAEERCHGKSQEGWKKAADDAGASAEAPHRKARRRRAGDRTQAKGTAETDRGSCGRQGRSQQCARGVL
jgi:hypothetical protein